MLNQSLDQTTRSDAWEGYPSQIQELFEFIVDNNIDNIVFLSGDEHLSCAATATLSKRGKLPRKIASVHASGLYAPFPFANSEKEDFVDGLHCLNLPDVNCTSVVNFAPSTARFARLSVEYRALSSPFVSVEFLDSDGSPCFSQNLFP
jgi:PhoD-like phosphatase